MSSNCIFDLLFVIFVGMSNLVLRMMYLVSEKISFIDPER